MLRYVPSIPTLVRVFNHEWMLVLSNAFSASIEMIVSFLLTFLLLMWCITLLDLCMLNHHWELGMSHNWLWCMSFFDVFLDLVGLILLRIFVPMFIKYIGLYFYFFVVYFSVFGSRVISWTSRAFLLYPFLLGGQTLNLQSLSLD